MTLLMRLAGTSPICLSLGSDTAADNIEVTKINGAAANGVRIKFAQENPSSGSLQIDLVRAALLLCGVAQLHSKAAPKGVSDLPVCIVCASQQCDGTARGAATQPEPPAYQTEATTVWPTFYSCPAHQNRAGDWGWPLLILLSVSGVLYVGAGYGYNYKMKGGEVSHPHSHHWQVAKDQGPGLVMDGIFFTRCQLSDKVGFLSFLAPSEEDRRRFDSDKSHLLPGDGETSAAGRTSSKKDKRSKEKDNKRRKSDHKSSKSSKKDRRESKSKYALVPAPDDGQPGREIKDVAPVEERVMDIEIAEGNVKE